MTRQQIIDGFHALYLKKIGEACRAAGGTPKSGLPIAELTAVFNETVAEYYVQLLKPFFPTLDVSRIDEVDLKLWGAEHVHQPQES